MTYQQILEVQTNGGDLWSEAVGWTFTDPIRGEPLLQTPRDIRFALGLGWRVLKWGEDPDGDGVYEWVLHRIVDVWGRPS